MYTDNKIHEQALKFVQIGNTLVRAMKKKQDYILFCDHLERQTAKLF